MSGISISKINPVLLAQLRTSTGDSLVSQLSSRHGRLVPQFYTAQKARESTTGSLKRAVPILEGLNRNFRSRVNRFVNRRRQVLSAPSRSKVGGTLEQIRQAEAMLGAIIGMQEKVNNQLRLRGELTSQIDTGIDRVDFRSIKPTEQQIREQREQDVRRETDPIERLRQQRLLDRQVTTQTVQAQTQVLGSTPQQRKIPPSSISVKPVLFVSAGRIGGHIDFLASPFVGNEFNGQNIRILLQQTGMGDTRGKGNFIRFFPNELDERIFYDENYLGNPNVDLTLFQSPFTFADKIKTVRITVKILQLPPLNIPLPPTPEPPTIGDPRRPPTTPPVVQPPIVQPPFIPPTPIPEPPIPDPRPDLPPIPDEPPIEEDRNLFQSAIIGALGLGVLASIGGLGKDKPKRRKR